MIDFDHDTKIDADQQLKDELSEAKQSLEQVADDIDDFEDRALTY